MTAVHPHAGARLRQLLIAAVIALPFLAYVDTVRSIVGIWDSSGTFAHGYVILPIALWLIWQRRAALRALPLLPWPPALLALAACGFAWLLAALGEVQIVRQYAFAAMLPLTVLAILGRQMAGAMLFPLCFILFAVPFGEIFIDPLIGVTADFTVDALRATGIPVFREGNNFTIPSGSWSVVEACSGVRYLISSVTLGALYAYLTYRSPWRRLAFALLSIVVPIVANGMRAYLIVMIGHLSGMTLAVGFDHLIYGWVFFGLVMFILFWLGSFWREDEPPAPPVPEPAQTTQTTQTTQTSASNARLGAAALAIAVCIGVWPLWLAYLERGAPAPALLPPAGLAGMAQAAPFSSWRPAFSAPAAELRAFYDGDRPAQPVGLTLLYYGSRAGDGKLISSSNRLTGGHDTGWREQALGRRAEALGAQSLALRESVVSGAGARLLVWSWYWIDGATTANDYLGKLLQIRQRLLGGRADGAAVLLYSPYDEHDPAPARAALRAFLGAHTAQIDAALTRQGRP